MRPAAPSLDIIAAGENGQAGDVDSRTSSSATSPAPADHEESDFGSHDSDSSVCIPNMQDMQVADGSYECDVPIHQLPNEILISIFTKLDKPHEVLQCMLTCKRWARNAVDLLWHRPSCTAWSKLETISKALTANEPYFAYHSFIKRLNLAALAEKLNDGSVGALSSCNRVERLTLTNCKNLTDGGVIPLIENSTSLLALDVSGDPAISDATILSIARNCRRLQGLNVSGCLNVSDASMIELARACKYIKRLKLNECVQLTDSSILSFAEHCPNILEIDLHNCSGISNDPITSLLTKGQSLRELRLAGCENISDEAFLSLPLGRTYDHLRILDLTACQRLTDHAVQKIIDVAPRLRNLVLAKCRDITDSAVYAISRLGKNLHYVHLGHCGQITDEAVKRLVQCCNRIRYIDLGCCTNLTDDSVTRLATLPKLKRIGLVKCSNITDSSVLALARTHRPRPRRDGAGNYVMAGEGDYYHSSLERVHLSYCVNLTLKSIIKLLNSCPRLTHLSLTGVPAFLRNEFQRFGREPPPEFTDHQREVFCVFSGNCVNKLRQYLNDAPEYAGLRQPLGFRPAAPTPVAVTGDWIQPGDGEMDDGDEEDGFEGLDGSEVVGVATHPPGPGPGPHGAPLAPPPPLQNNGILAAGVPLPPPPPPPPPGLPVVQPADGSHTVIMDDDNSAGQTPEPDQDD